MRQFSLAQSSALTAVANDGCDDMVASAAPNVVKGEAQSALQALAQNAGKADNQAAVSNGLASEVFAVRVEYALKELAMTGYDAIDSGFVSELRQLAQVATEIGFAKVGSLLSELVTSCENFVRYNENEQAQAITSAVAHLFFALSFLNFGGGNSSVANDASAHGQINAVSSDAISSLGAEAASTMLKVDDELGGGVNQAATSDKEAGDLSPEFLAALDSDDDFL